jgi:glycosyltransferase involved in cell wall biosynthesis
LCRSDVVVALGESMAEELTRAGARAVEVIHNWADGEAIRPRPVERHPLRASWGWDGRFVVLYSGNLGLAHEFETLLGAAERLRQEPGVLFAFIGDGPRRPEVEERARRRGLGNVEFRPYVRREELGLSLTAGDVHLITLRSGMEGLLVPSKVYGILAAGRPSLYVGPGRGEIAAILDQGGCGRRVAEGDVAGLVHEIRAYAAEPARREIEGQRARRLFDERFTRERALARFASILQAQGRHAPA